MTKTLIIAEAGVNHNGSLENAKKLIDVAVEAKVDFVKFQTFKAEKLVSKSAKKADYQIDTTGKEEGQYQMIKKLELNREMHETLIQYCKAKGIKFLSTAFDLESIDLLMELGIEIFKVPSGEITNLPYLEKIGSLGKPIILSTGMSDLGDIEKAIKVLVENGAEQSDLIVLHCNTEYPTPFQDVNLKAMNTIGSAFGVKIGYSDHTLGIEVPIAAVAMGAVCIEKHFTLDRNMPGPDHRSSLEPEELKEMVRSIRNIEVALGSTIKKPSESELKNVSVARKSIHTARDLKKGTKITREDIQMKRPGTGISPMDLELVLGGELLEDCAEDAMLTFQNLRL